MTTHEERSPYAVTLDELERSAHVPPGQQVAEQVATSREPAISEYKLQTARLLGIEHAG